MANGIHGSFIVGTTLGMNIIGFTTCSWKSCPTSSSFLRIPKSPPSGQHPEGVLHPYAYFSQKNSPAECNYEIHDKELLAIVKCCREWESELKSVRDFLVLTDHKNLTYFTTTKKLNERQIRWQEFLSQFNFRIKYRPGHEGTLPDVLSRREQDMPQDANDRFVHREACLLKPEVFVNTRRIARVNYLRVATPPLFVKPATANITLEPSEWQELEALWKTAELNAPQWQAAVQAVKDGKAKFPPDLELKVSISECTVNAQSQLLFRD
ncbi:hypothetical protein VTO42DRAFT_5289 [Malbranchea cinnamomea]